jgi:PAS domain-containing protein
MVHERFPRDYKYMTRSTSSPPKEFRVNDNDAAINARGAQGILQAMPVLLDAFDDEGCIVACNAECERVTGYSAAAIVANCRALEMLYPERE